MCLTTMSHTLVTENLYQNVKSWPILQQFVTARFESMPMSINYTYVYTQTPTLLNLLL